jgi:predicted RNase H-like HicB family nuclease
MKLFIAIYESGDDLFGVSVPDLPGVHSFGESVEEAVGNAREAIHGHVATMIQRGMRVTLRASTMDRLAAIVEYAGAIWVLLDVDLSMLEQQPVEISVEIPALVLRKIDAHLATRAESRDEFLARAALQAIAQG